MLMPISQSAIVRHFPAAANPSTEALGRMFWKARRMPSPVIDCSQSRLRGLLHSACSMISRKISSPSRPASQALITPTMSGRDKRATRCVSRFCCEALGVSGINSGMIGSAAKPHCFFGICCSRRWPLAAATTCVSDS